MYDLGELVRLHAVWRASLPRVAPFYAVKCNPEPGLMAMLDALGAGFDCASIQELERAAALGVPQSRIIFANPCKVGRRRVPSAPRPAAGFFWQKPCSRA